LLDAVGSGVMMPLSILFFTVHKGMAPTTVGLGITIGGLVALLAAPLGGHLIDDIGPKRSLIGGCLVAAVGFAGFPLVHTLPELAVVQVVANVSGSMSWTATSTMLGQIRTQEQLPGAMAAQYSLRNLGFGTGGLLAAVALAVGGVGFDVAVYLDVASFLIAAALVVPVSAPVRPDSQPMAGRDPVSLLTVLRDWRYVTLGLAGSLIYFNQTGLQVVLPLWVVLYTHAPRAIVGALFTFNTAMVVFGQVRMASLVQTLSDAPRAYRRGALLMAIGSVTFLASHYCGELMAIGLLTAGTALLTLTEMSVTAAGMFASVTLADPEHRGKYLSVYGLGFGLEGTVGPSAGTALTSAGVLVPWPAITALVMLGTLTSAVMVEGASSRIEPAAPA
jgi:MFS family permease